MNKKIKRIGVLIYKILLIVVSVGCFLSAIEALLDKNYGLFFTNMAGITFLHGGTYYHRRINFLEKELKTKEGMINSQKKFTRQIIKDVDEMVKSRRSLEETRKKVCAEEKLTKPSEVKKEILRKLPPKKIKVWISSPDNVSFYHEDYFEVTSESYDEIERIARMLAFDHIEWGFEEVKE